MATAYGLTLAGFVRKRQEAIRESLRAGLKAEFGDDIDTSSKSSFAKLIDPFSAELDLAWQALEGVYKASDAQAAPGLSLENLYAPLIGPRLLATPSVVSVTVTADEGTTYPEGTGFRASTLGVDLISTEEVTVGVTGGASIPLVTVETGPIAIAAGLVDSLVAFIPGHTGVANPLAATPGEAVEDDAAYRARAVATRRARTQRLEDSVEGKLLTRDLIQHARFVSNRSNDPSDAWVSPTSGALLQPGDYAVTIFPELTDIDELDAIAEILWRDQGAGGQYAGDVERLVTMANGRDYTVRWTWVDPVEVYGHLVILVGPDAPADVGDQLEALVVERGNELGPGENVVQYRLEARGDEIRGVKNVTLFLSTSPSPTSTDDLVIASTSIARFDLSRMTSSVVTS